MKTVLITGIRSFTGKYLSADLRAAGFDVHGTIYGDSNTAENEWVVDLANRQAMQDLINKIKPDMVVHLAAISFVAHEDVSEIYRTNIIGTRNLLEALAQTDKLPSSILLASSANVYGNNDTDYITESMPVNPTNDYSVSKVAMEHVAKLWTGKLPITITRPFNYTGLGQAPKFLVPKIVNHFSQGLKKIELGNLDVARDFSDVRTVSRIYAKLLEGQTSGETFNICSGKRYTLEAIIEMMQEIAGYQIEVNVNPDFVRQDEIKSFRGSNSKLSTAIGEIDNIPLQSTLRWMYEKS